MTKKSEKSTCVVACAVFKPVVKYLQMTRRYPNLRLTYLPSNLHLNPQELKERLLEEVVAARGRGERVICLYGDCFPDIDGFCQQHGIIKVAGHYCYEMLLGTEQFKQLVEQVTGTYFAERDLILNFKKYCVGPLELADEEMRRYCFQQYRRLLYVRQPLDPELVARARKIAKFLELSMDVCDADYSYLEKQFIELI